VGSSTLRSRLVLCQQIFLAALPARWLRFLPVACAGSHFSGGVCGGAGWPLGESGVWNEGSSGMLSAAGVYCEVIRRRFDLAQERGG
jgi:hypothetical protein